MNITIFFFLIGAFAAMIQSRRTDDDARYPSFSTQESGLAGFVSKFRK
jgi:hypothetical protein